MKNGTDLKATIRKVGEWEMRETEKAINCLTDIENILIARQDMCPPEELQYWVELQEGVADALSMLKEMQERKQDRCIICPHCGRKVM